MKEPEIPQNLTSRDEIWEARYHRNSFLLMMVVLAIAPWLIYPQFVMLALCFGLFACAFNLLIGFGGLLSFGHAMFLGMASYFAAYLAKSGLNLETVTIFSRPFTLGLHMAPLSPALAIVAAVAGTTVLGYVAGLLAIKRQGIYFAMITLALAQMVFFFCLQAPLPAARTASRPCPGASSSGCGASRTTCSCTTWSWPCSPRACSSSIASSTRPSGRC